MRHVDAKIKILLVLFYYYNFTFVSIMNCDRQKFSIVTLHESKVHYAAHHIKSGCISVLRTVLTSKSRGKIRKFFSLTLNACMKLNIYRGLLKITKNT